jgi:hypothetical protein
MKITAEIIIGFLILAIFIGFYSFKQKLNDKSNHDLKKTEVKENPYQRLRTLAINTTAEQLQLQSNNDHDIYGILMDWNIGSAIVTVVAFKTGDASIYISTGSVLIGGRGHENIIKAAKKFIKTGEKYISKAKKTDQTEPTHDEKVNFYFLTKAGRYYIEDDMAHIENYTSDLRKLFIVGDEVITEYRLIINNSQ